MAENEPSSQWVWGDEITPPSLPPDDDPGDVYTSVEELIQEHPEVVIEDDRGY